MPTTILPPPCQLFIVSQTHGILFHVKLPWSEFFIPIEKAGPLAPVIAREAACHWRLLANENWQNKTDQEREHCYDQAALWEAWGRLPSHSKTPLGVSLTMGTKDADFSITNFFKELALVDSKKTSEEAKEACRLAREEAAINIAELNKAVKNKAVKNKDCKHEWTFDYYKTYCKKCGMGPQSH